MDGPASSTTGDLRSKGLRRNALGLLSSVTIGLASTAPAFSLAATVGFIVIVVGTQAPAAIVLAFIPMAFIAVAYRDLNRAMPDCGTTFTWGTKAFGPHIGWMGGWGLAITGIIFMANAADIVGHYTLELVNRPDLLNDKAAVSAIGIGFILIMTWVAYRGIEGSARLQQALVAFQVLMLIGMSILALVTVARGGGMAGAQGFSWAWLNPFLFEDWGSFVEAMLLAVFIYWGWDSVLAVNEETEDSDKTPGRAALLSTVLLLGCYLLVTIALQSFAGTGEEGLGNLDHADDVFGVISEPLLGSWGAPLLLLTVLVSAVSSMQTTILPTARGTLAMGVYRALPKRFAKVHPRFLTPSFSTIMMAVVSIAFYFGFKLISDNMLQDTILSISLSIAFYYAITAFSAVWYFRRESWRRPRDFLVQLLLPLLGGIALAAIFVQSAIDMWQPDYGSTTLLGIGGVFVVGIGSLLIGVVLMFIWQLTAPAFFRGETLRTDTPVLAPDPD
ncbi:MAG: APC family permease [Candidatus Nanopelagicales bacterium]|nr:APC family permease [Candidatus Nanopelagicales bacterium]